MNTICGIHMAESLIGGRNFVSGICKLKSKNIKNVFKKLGFYQPCFWLSRSIHREGMPFYRWVAEYDDLAMGLSTEEAVISVSMCQTAPLVVSSTVLWTKNISDILNDQV